MTIQQFRQDVATEALAEQKRSFTENQLIAVVDSLSALRHWQSRLHICQILQHVKIFESPCRIFSNPTSKSVRTTRVGLRLKRLVCLKTSPFASGFTFPTLKLLVRSCSAIPSSGRWTLSI